MKQRVNLSCGFAVRLIFVHAAPVDNGVAIGCPLMQHSLQHGESLLDAPVHAPD